MKKILSSVLCLAMLASMGTTVFAADSHSATADLTTEAMVFDLSVPLSLGIAVDSAGVVEVATTCKIVNNSAGMVKVTDVALTTSNDWEIVAYDTDFTQEKVGLTQFGIVLNGDEVDTTGAVTLTDSWVSLDAKGGELPILYSVNVASQSSALNVTIATVQFTIDWDSVA